MNSGITEPPDAKTLPYLVAQKIVSPGFCILDLAITNFSANALDKPIAFIG